MTGADDLIARLEAATEGSRELDRLIHNSRKLSAGINITAEPYTTSLDAALTLVPEGCAAEIHVGLGDIYSAATVFVPRRGVDDQKRRTTRYEPHDAPAVKNGKASQQPAALAVCIAALKARGAR